MSSMNGHFSTATKESMSVKGHQGLAQTLYFTAMIPPVGMALLCSWLLPQLPALQENQYVSFETPFLGFTLLSAVLCDTMYYLRLRRFRALPTLAELATIPPMAEVKRGWRACLVAWGLVQVYALLGVMEVFFTRVESGMYPFMIFAAITMYRCRPRAGLFAESMWGSSLHSEQRHESESQNSTEIQPPDNTINEECD